LDRNASKQPLIVPIKFGWYAPLVVGKLLEAVYPVMYAFPALSTATPYPQLLGVLPELPPMYVLYTKPPLGLNLDRNAS
jgi:hypothetical protein